MLAISVPLASSSVGGNDKAKPGKTYIAPILSKRANNHPNTTISVIVQVDPSFELGKRQVEQLFRKAGIPTTRDLRLINGMAVTMQAKWIDKLAKIDGVTVTPDAPVRVSSYSSNQLWPYESGLASGWSSGDAPQAGTVPTIAVVDSGIDAARTDFGSRVLANVNLATLPENSPGDGRGHGTFVAGIAAGAAQGYAGAMPQANLVSIDVMNDHGVARTSDVIAACQWILANKGKYNIRIANFSLHSGAKGSFTRDPLDKAVEKLWFSGVVVVAAAGNYGTATGPSGVPYAPGNDPFVITVGAIDIGGTKNRHDDFAAPWSAWGYTLDGFSKPEIVAPGRYMIGPVPHGSTLTVERADKVTAPGYIQLSGTSFAAPVIAGAAAQILARHPEFTPDQVKGALMVSAKPVEDAAPGSVGVGELQMSKAAALLRTPPNPNLALNRFLVNDPAGGGAPMFNSVSWLDAAKASVSWDSVSWADTALADVSWADVSWNDTSYEDAAEGDTSGDANGYELTPEEAAAIMADEELAPPADTLPAAVATVLAQTTTSSPTDGAIHGL